MTPRATYRLQLQKDFGFDDAAALAPYLAKLGVSHVYCSPYFTARPGSEHGYDVTNHNQMNPELGGEEGFARMCTAFAEHGLKHICDFVPNHTGIWGSDNWAWLDVLEWGEASPSAGWFDIDWNADRKALQGKVLAPVLGDQYGVALDAGQLDLRFDAQAGAFAVWAYGEHKLPINPHHYAMVLGDDHPVLERLADGFSSLDDWRPQTRDRAAALKSDLAALVHEHKDVAEAIERRIARFNGADADGARSRLDALIQAQSWRPSHFRVAADDINYRRFFNINDLAGVRVELPEVFDRMHRRLLELVRDGLIDGVRIDHIDGLLDPRGYLEQLRGAIGDTWLIVEKILATHEDLRADWPVDGTTGYEFANLALGLLVDPKGEAGLTRTYRTFTGERDRFADLIWLCKRQIMDNEMASELHRLSGAAAAVARQTPRTADFTQNLLRRAIREVVASFPVYRTYVDEAHETDVQDRRDLDWAIVHARRRHPDLDPSVFDFLHAALSGDLVAEPKSGFSRHAVLGLAMKLQQYSGPVMAKGLEDTAFYRFNRLVALNEVGGAPDQMGVSLAAFHKANQNRAERWPGSLLAGTTHDTKRGEDARARLAVLSELADDWEKQVWQWSRLLRARRGDAGDSGPPDPNDEYLLYQMLLGSWPIELMGPGAPNPAALAAYAERIKTALIKSMREAKVHSTWAAPDEDYEKAMLDFAGLALDPVRGAAFLELFRPFAERVAELGAHNSLVETVLRLTVPGVPDIYQGAELWELSLVDPDNRRPVDFAARATLLDAVEDLPVPALAEAWRDGRVKLATVSALLSARRRHPELFARGDYQALSTGSDQIGAYLRRAGGEALLVVVRRFATRAPEPGGGFALPTDLGDRVGEVVLRRRSEVLGSRLDLDLWLGEAPAAVVLWAGDRSSADS